MTPADLMQLTALREEIELLDATLVDTIARRMTLAKEIRVVKQRAGQPVLDPAREAAVVARASARARTAGLPEDEIRALYWKLMALARRVQVES
ncbi:chorismate mutase [Gemmatimonas sp.]